MSSPTAVPCREIFDENSQPSAEEISEYAQQLGIDPDSESHLLPLARDGLMQALPTPWKAYFDEKLQTHYYYNEDTKKTQWEHPLDNVYRELVKKARDASIQDDTCASVQDLLTSEENTKHLERVETKVESDDDLSTDSENNASGVRDSTMVPKNIRLAPLGRPPMGPSNKPNKLERRLTDLKLIPKSRPIEMDYSKHALRNAFERDILNRPAIERPKMLFKQQSEIIDLKIHVLNSPEEDNFSPLLSGAKIERGLPLQGKGTQFLRVSKSDLPSPDTDKSLPLDSMTKSDPPKGILREKLSDSLQRKSESLWLGRPKHSSSLDEDRKSVRFKLENLPEPTISPGSNSSSEQNDQNSIASAPPPAMMPLPSPLIPSSPISSPVPLNPNSIVLSPLVHRPPLPPRPNESPREKSVSGSEKDSMESDRGTSPRRRVVRPPAADYIKPDLFQKNFQKIADLVRPGDIEPATTYLEEPVDKEARPRSPMIPQQKNKISINLMESIESETSIDSPDKEYANLDLNDLDISNEVNEQNDSKPQEKYENKDSSRLEESSEKSNSKTSNSTQNKSPLVEIAIPQIKVPKLDLSPKPKIHSESEDSKNIEDPKTKSESIEIKSPQIKISPTASVGSDLRSPRYDFSKPWSSPLSTFKPLNKAVIAPLKSSESNSSLGKGLTSPRLDGVILSQGKSSSDNVVVVYQFENSQEENLPKPIKSPMMLDMAARDMLERNKGDERRRLELSLQKELENIRVEWCAKERKMRAELQDELTEAEQKFLAEKRVRLQEQAERHKREMEQALESAERIHQEALEKFKKEMEERRRRDIEAMERRHSDDMARLMDQYQSKLTEKRQQLEIENDRALSEVQSQLQAHLVAERSRLTEENRATTQQLREEHAARIADIRTDYRAEVDRLRTQHACHLEEIRSRLASERAAPRQEDRALAEKYKCLKEKYARLKHDVKMSIERRNKRREMSMTTGSETEKSNSHKANQSLEKCKEVNETSVSAVIEPEPRARTNNNLGKYNDNETSHSESNAQKSYDNNNDDWKHRRDHVSIQSGVMEPRARTNNNLGKYNDNETSHSESNAQKSYDNNNDDWKHRRDHVSIQRGVMEPRARTNDNLGKYNDNETSHSESNAQKSYDNNNDDWKHRRDHVSMQSGVMEPRARTNNNLGKYNDNETSHSESNAQKSYDNNNDDWKQRRDHVSMQSGIMEPRARTNNNLGKYNDNETSHSESNAQKSYDNNNDDWKQRRDHVSMQSGIMEPRARTNNNLGKYNDNETSHSESNAQKSYDNNNDDWKQRRDHSLPGSTNQQPPTKRAHRRTAVAFREPPGRGRDRDRDKDGAVTTDCQDSSDATTADEKPKEPINGHGRRRCFTRLKSASTSRLNYSPKRGEGWSSPLESLRQQLRKLDDLEDQFPDLACQPSYSLRYPFAELGAVARADTPELEFVRHRALVEREGMRRARAVLKTRRAALRETRATMSPHRAPSEEREVTELEVALHRARALLGEKEIRLRHIERALRKLTDAHAPPPAPLIQEATTSEASSGSEEVVEATSGAVLRSLRALHADVRDIWRALEVRPRTASPETSSANPPTTSQTRMTLSAPDPIIQDHSEGSVAERARGIRAWLQTAP